MNIPFLLEHRKTIRLSWGEPWAANDSQDRRFDAHVQLSATVDDCIGIQRWTHLHHCLDAGHEYTPDTEADLLTEFITIHWASVIEEAPALEEVPS